MRHLLWTFLLLLSFPTLAQGTPDAVVRGFYDDYTLALQHNPQRWVQTLMANQRDQVERELHDWLVRLADGKPGGDGPWLDFDPFSNSQMGIDSYTVGQPSFKDGLAYVPVKVRFSRDSGPERLRTRVVLRQHGNSWKIANFAYPAEAGMEAWDLRGFLRESFSR